MRAELCPRPGHSLREARAQRRHPPTRDWPRILTARPFLNRSSVRKFESIRMTEAPCGGEGAQEAVLSQLRDPVFPSGWAGAP